MRFARKTWMGAILMAMLTGVMVLAGPAAATSHTESTDCTGTGFRACVNAKLDLQTMQIDRLQHKVKYLKGVVATQTDEITALQTQIKPLVDTYNCQLADLLNVTTTPIVNTTGNTVDALILNHHTDVLPGWAMVFNGCHSNPPPAS